MSAISNRMLLAAAGSVAVMASAASADILLLVDLSVANEITISATDGLSAATASGGDGTGVLLAGFYDGSDSGSGFLNSAGMGDFTNAENPTDNSPGIFRAGGSAGLNIWTWSPDATVTFTAGSLAFTGSGTWSVTAAQYADLLASNTGGDLYFPADDDGDIASATLLGEWAIVPTPGAAGLLGLAGIAAVRRRR